MGPACLSRGVGRMGAHSFHGVNFEVSRPLRPIGSAELESAEAALGCRFPSDYREFVLRFGAGEFDELTLRVFSPSQIVRMTPEDRDRFSQYWFWVDSPEVWTKEKAIESIACFDGSCGDDIRFHPSDPQTMYLLPHEKTVIYRFTSFADIIGHFRREFSPDSDGLTFT
jgi:hypothetical protein